MRAPDAPIAHHAPMSSAVRIRSATPTDVDAISAVVSSAFPSSLEARLVTALREAGRLIVELVASLDDRLVGQIAFSPVTIAGAPQLAGLGLAPLAVVPDCQGQGIGSRLIELGLEAASRVDAAFVVVLGEPRVYGRFGFERADRRGLDNEYGATEHFMVLELRSGALDGVRGLVRYDATFARILEASG
jgi:putative acetyltransferase